MDQELSLLIAGLTAEFLLRSTLGFLICLVLNQLLTKASARFMVWAAYLYGSAAYWVYLAGTLISQRRAVASNAVTLPQTASVGAHARFAWLTSWSVPPSWGSALSFAVGALAVAYGLFVLWAAISHANKLRRLRWVMGFATEAPEEIAEGFRSLARSLGMRPPRLRILSGAFSPATFGWVRPVVILPTICAEEQDSDLEDILLHELHHVRRCDAFWNMLGTTARTLICFHPAAWYAMSRMRIARELACDQAVVCQSPARKGIYAESLLRFARLNVAPEPNWGIDFAAPASHLTLRVHSILTEAKRVSPWLMWVRVATGLALVAIFFGVAPSLAILLEYAHPRTQPAGTTIETAQPAGLKVPRMARKTHGQSAPLVATEPALAVQSSQEFPAPVIEVRPDAAVEAHPDLSTGAGPHLQRRTTNAAAANAISQSIPLIDEGDNGESGRHSAAAQTAQQTATVAAAIWKRAGDLDRH